jgi:hypothetical protein
MGIDAGFDLYPPVDFASDDAQDLWNCFFCSVRDHFQDDPDVEFSDGCLVFQVAEHPSLPWEGKYFRRFSSKVSGREGGAAEFYIKTVAALTRKHYDKRVYYWSEYGDAPNTKYNWWDVHEAERAQIGQETELKKMSGLPLDTVATAVLSAFEKVHQGMDGLRFKEALFPDNAGYRIVHENVGLSSVVN